MKLVWGIVGLCLLSLSANAELQRRAGGQAYYDTDTGLTWVGDADLARTLGYDPDGRLAWYDPPALSVFDFIDWLNAQNNGEGYLHVHWRLPTTTQPDPNCDSHSTVGDYGGGCILSEMGHLYYITLVNTGGITHTGPFWNTGNQYWTGTERQSNTDYAWSFNFNSGNQVITVKYGVQPAWPVHDGDIGVVPIDDVDGDGVAFAIDNCTLVANPSQLDADADGYGNRCDGDLNNTGAAFNVNTADYTILRSVINKAYTYSTNAARADLNGDGTVNTTDYSIFRSLINNVPGPSGYACAGTIPCP